MERGHGRLRPHRAAPPQVAELERMVGQVKERNVIGPRAGLGLGYGAGPGRDQQPAAVRGGDVPPAGQPPDHVPAVQAGRSVQGVQGVRDAAAGREAQRPVHEDGGRHPAAPGGPAARAAGAAAARPGPAIRAAGAGQLDVHTVQQSSMAAAPGQRQARQVAAARGSADRRPRLPGAGWSPPPAGTAGSASLASRDHRQRQPLAKAGTDMTWTWQLEKQDGTVLTARGLPKETFASQGDAESWIGENWRSLLEAGVDQVILLDDGTPEYGPMSLHPAG